MYDLIVKGGKIIDGSGGESYVCDVAVKDGKIAKIAREIEDARKIINANGLCVTPGFIDSHSHADSAAFTFPDMKEKIEQGITTAITGQCGESAAPLSKRFSKNSDEMLGKYGKKYDICHSVPAYLEHGSHVNEGCNLATFVGHGAIRSAVLGMENRAPTEDELEQMKGILREAMRAGAYGMSLGLYYTPGAYASTEEVIELAKVVAEEGGVVSSHVRSEGDDGIAATAEFINIIKISGARGVHSHIKATGEKNFGQVKTKLEMIEKANTEGADIYCDVYPYIASHTSMASTFVPPELHAGGMLLENLRDKEKREIAKQFIINTFGKNDISWALVVHAKNRPDAIGKRVSEIARERECDPCDAVFDIILDSERQSNACYFRMDEGDLEVAIGHPRAMICTDSGVSIGRKTYHPRLRASFPRALGVYARERGIVSMPEMIRKMTSLPAHVYGLNGKGLIKEGYDADICIFTEDKLIDRATFTEPTLGCEGLNYVIVSGEVVCEDGVHNGGRFGRMLRKNR